MANTGFFEERSDQSEVKAKIVQKYFSAWASVIVGAQKRFGSGDRIAYVDLYAGPGRYQDGAASTPLLVLESAIKNPEVAARLVSLFNDGDQNKSATLQAEIDNFPGIETLKHKPTVLSTEVGADFENMFRRSRMVPTFSFIDPFGYKGLSLKIVNAVIKDWGCDCVFFFNYNRINMGLRNEKVAPHMDALFGKERADRIREGLATLAPGERDAFILNELATAIQQMGGEYVLPFRFKREESERTSHYLVFVSKNIRGYDIMKQIMASESSTTDQGVPSFTYAPADARYPLLFSLSRPLDALGGLLLEKFAGQALSMKKIYEQHNVGTRFIPRNYKEVLNRLEAEGKITAKPAAPDRPVRNGQTTFADKVMVTFPRLNA